MARRAVARVERLRVVETPPPASFDHALRMVGAFRTIVDRIADRLYATEKRLKEANAALKKKDERIEELEGDLETAAEEYSALEDRITLDGEAINELACIEQKIKRGRPDEARGDLDRLLQRVDGGGMYRLNAVAVML